MTSTRTSGPQAHDSPIGDLSLEFAFSSKLQGPELHRKGNSAVYRPPHKASEPAFYKSFFAVSVVSVALVYLVFQCIQTISFYRGVKAPTRSLAASGSRGGFCFNWPEEGGAEDPPSDEDEHQGGASKTRPSPASTALAAWPRGQQAQTTWWGFRQMPRKWQGRTRHVLGGIQKLATTALSLLPSLTPQDAVVFSMHLSMVAGVELATYAYIPDNLQPLRTQAGKAFIELIQTVLDMESTRSAAVDLDLESRLDLLRRFHEELAEFPPPTEKFKDYKLTTIAWWRTGHFTVTQAAAHLSALQLEGSQSVIPSYKVRAVCKVFDAIFQTRKMQLLRSLTMRHWFVICQRRVQAFILFTLEEYKEAQTQPPPSSVSPSEQVYYAIVAAGGTVIPVELPDSETDNKQFSKKAPTAPDSGTGSAQSPSPVLYHHHSGLPLVPSTVPPAPGFGPLPLPSLSSAPPKLPPPPDFGPLHLTSRLPGRGQPTPPLQPQPPESYPRELLQGPHPPGPRHPAFAVQPPEQPLQSGASANREALGARPRTGAAARKRASEAGWGRRQVPPYWEGKLSDLLEAMQTAAVACCHLLPSLSPQQAVLMSKLLSMVSTLQLSALSYLPEALQPTRTAAGESHRILIGKVLADHDTLLAALLMNEVDSLQSLHELLGIVSRPSPPTETLPVGKYQRKIIIHYNTCSYAYRQVMHFLEDMLRAQQSSGASIPQADVFVNALQGMYQVLKKQLLRDAALRHPLVVAHKGRTGFSLVTQEEVTNADQSRKPRLNEVIEDLRQAVVKAGGSPVDVYEAQTSAASRLGQSQSSELSHVAAQPIAGPPPQQMAQQLHASFVLPPKGLEPPPGLLTYQAHAASAPTHAFQFSPSLPPQWTWHSTLPPRAPTSFEQPRHPHWASPWPSSFLKGFQAPPGAPSAQHGGIVGSAGRHQHLGSPGDAEGLLGLHDLAARLSKLNMFDFEDEEDN